MNINKLNFHSTHKYASHKPKSLPYRSPDTKQLSPYQSKVSERRNSQKPKDFLVPLEKFSHREYRQFHDLNQVSSKEGFRITKPLKAQSKSTQKDRNAHSLTKRTNFHQKGYHNKMDLHQLKNTMINKKQRQSLQLAAITKKKPSSNRMVTQKLKTKQHQSYGHFQPENLAITKYKSKFIDRNHIFQQQQATQENNFIFSQQQSLNKIKKNNIARPNKLFLRNQASKQKQDKLISNKNLNNSQKLAYSQNQTEKKTHYLTTLNTKQKAQNGLSAEKYNSIQINLRKTSNPKKSSRECSNSKQKNKKLSQFQTEQSKNFEIYYIGRRRIVSQSDFTDNEGDPRINVGDSIAYKYEILQNLGRGSFGKVFKAFDHKKKQYVALKVIKCQQKFVNQAKIQVQILQTALLHDPKLKCNLVRMKNSFQFRGHPCITFQILHKNLYQFLKQNNFSGFTLDLIRRFAIQILQTLLFFSHFKIIHCDLKPENILLKEENKSGIKVIDVGSGCFQPKQLYTYIQSRFYRAPQIILGLRYTSAIDIWSFGCILIQLFTGFPIFPGENQNDQMLMFMEILGPPPYSMLQNAERRRKFFNDNFKCQIPQEKGKERIFGSVTFQQLLGDCDPDFIDLLQKCLQWDPKKRITPRQALLHKWIVNGLPQSIKQQHIEQITNYKVR